MVSNGHNNNKSLERLISRRAMQIGSSTPCKIWVLGFFYGVCIVYVLAVALLPIQIPLTRSVYPPLRRAILWNSTLILDFYCWTQAIVFNTADKILNSNVSVPEEKACSTALHLMFHILRWSFKHAVEHANSDAKINSSLRSDAINMKKCERSFAKPRSMWSDILISSGHTTWALNFYTALRQKYSYDTLWGDSPIAVSCKQLIVQLCSVADTVFPNDNGDAQIKHLIHILSAVIL